MGNVLKPVAALVVGFAIGAYFIADIRNKSGLRTSGHSTGYSVFVPNQPEDVFAVLADIEAWPTWQDAILQIVRDTKNPDRISVVGVSGSTDYDVIVDDYGSRIQLTAVPAGELVEGKVTIQVERTRRDHARITVIEYVQLQKQSQISDEDVGQHERFSEFASSFGTELVSDSDTNLLRVDHWDRLLGCWTTLEESLAAHDSGWEPSAPAEWHFEKAYDGLGIVDTYTSPPKSVPITDESSRQRGMNLRIYNGNLEHWIVTWLTTASTTPVTFTAKPSGDNLEMYTAVPNPQGFYSRITYFDIEPDSFEWKLELSRDRQDWKETYRIHASRGCESTR